MKRPFLLFLPFLLFVAGAFVACEEVQEEGKYDNWQQRNEAFIDSIKTKTGDRKVLTATDADNMVEGELYAIQVPTTSSNVVPQYVYCKKLVKNEVGARPNFSGYNSSVSAFYYGTFITGDEFDGNFDGYGATDGKISLPLSDPSSDASKWPTVFDSPSEFAVTNVIPGWTWTLQYMRVGERWMLYIPWQNGYGASGNSSGTIPGYTSLTFDVYMVGIVK